MWSSTYGCTTFAAAQAGSFQPSTTANQACPDYTYIQILKQENISANTCTGGKIASCFTYLNTNGGTPNISNAALQSDCTNAWSQYGGGGQQADGRFQVLQWKGMPLNNGATGLENMRTVISTGTPIVYGTRLYTDFPTYDDNPPTYVGNNCILHNKKTGQVAGHCMMIIGYDDTRQYGNNQQGAVLIQNSFGSSWGGQWNGNGGYVWMAYTTFQTLAQGGGLYITSIANSSTR